MRISGLKPPLFIVGCGRSGTTIVYELLCEHPDLAWFSNYAERWPALPQLEARLTPASLESWVHALAPVRVAVSLPKFQIDPAGFSLTTALRALGMPLAFDPGRADFTAIADSPNPDERLFLSDVFHKAFVKVDEQGTEAAAATGVVMAARAVSAEARPVALMMTFAVAASNVGVTVIGSPFPRPRDDGSPVHVWSRPDRYAPRVAGHRS